MTDIVERLRIGIHTSEDESVLRSEAADEIERLRESLERMLLEFDFLVESGYLPDIRNDMIFDAARKALGEK